MKSVSFETFSKNRLAQRESDSMFGLHFYLMPHLRLIQILFFALCFLPVAPLLSSPADALPEQNLSTKNSSEKYALEFLYMNANTGGSSGGHSAVKLGRYVYHFQYNPDTSIFEVVQDEWDDFRFTYNFHENRDIVIQRLNVDKKVWQNVRDRFLIEKLKQEKALDQRTSAEEYLNLQKNFFNRKSATLKVDAAGHYCPVVESKNKDRNAVRESLKELIDKHHLSASMEEWSTPDPTLFMEETPQTIEELSDRTDRYKDALARTLVKSYLKGEHDICPSSILKSDLSVSQNRFENYREKLKDEIVQELSSFPVREGSGGRLLLLLARHAAIELTHKNGTLITINSIKERTSQPDEFKFTPEYKRWLEAMRDEIDRLLTLRLGKPHNSIDEDYHQIEKLNTLKNEMIVSLKEEKLPRTLYPSGLPLMPAMLPVPESINARSPLQEETLHDLEDIHKRYLKKILKEYSYHLIKRNCSTELMRLVYEGATDYGKNEVKGFASYPDPYGSLNFIPAYLSSSIGKKLPVHNVHSLKGYRHAVLELRCKQMSPNKNCSLSLSKESLLPFSSIYYSVNSDPLFLVFSDDTFWFRPLTGGANFAYSSGALVPSAVMLPFDQGTLGKRAVDGILYSLPELFFQNIRRGSFPWITPKERQRIERAFPVSGRDPDEEND